MTTKSAVPVLGPEGWQTSSYEAAATLLSHFYLSDKSQSATFPKNVYSFQYILQQYNNDMHGLETALRVNLLNYFSVYFTDVSVEVTVPDSPSSNAEVVINLIAIDKEGSEIRLGKVFEVLDSKIKTVTNINNYGRPTL